MLPIEATQHTTPTTDNRIRRRSLLRRFLFVYLLLLVLVLLALLPPLINVNRFQHRIVTSISTTLGRPVHLDRVSLNLLPLPSFTLENFVVEEDPRFGYEPIIRANSVRATLRVSSLWRRRIEFSRIALDQPSLNLVHDADGRWNFENLLLQATQITAAPTAQPNPGSAPRFPYMEASGARINIKSGAEKLPFALTDADLALWLPTRSQWHLRLAGHPARTDTSASDTGLIELEGTFGSARTLPEMPLDLTGRWRNAPLGAASLVLLGRDANLRGDLALATEIHGTLGHSTITANAQLSDLRRAAFVPAQSLDIDATCQAIATGTFHSFHDIHCAWPSAPGKQLLTLTGDLPDLRRLDTASFALESAGLPASTLLHWLHVVSSSDPAEVTAGGVLTAQLGRDALLPSASSEPSHSPAAPSPTDQSPQGPQQPQGWTGNLLLHGATLSAPSLGNQPLELGDLAITAPAPAPSASRGHHAHSPSAPVSVTPNTTFLLAPTTLNLGGHEPALLEGHFDASGYTLHLIGTAVPTRLLGLAAALPQFGNGLPGLFPNPGATPTHIDLTAAGAWTAPHTWTRTTTANPSTPARHR